MSFTGINYLAVFVVTTNGVNNAFLMKPLALTIIDAGHWLFVLLLMGVIIGAFGV